MQRDFGKRGGRRTREQIRAQIELEFPKAPPEKKERIEILRYLMQDEDDPQKKAALASELELIERELRSSKTRLDIHFEGLVSEARTAWHDAVQQSSEKIIRDMQKTLAGQLPGATDHELKQLAHCMLRVKTGKAAKDEFNRLGAEIKKDIAARNMKAQQKQEKEEKPAAAAVADKVTKEKVEEMAAFLEESGTPDMQIIEKIGSVFKIDENNFAHENLKNIIDVLIERLGTLDDYKDMDRAGLEDCLKLLIT